MAEQCFSCTIEENGVFIKTSKRLILNSYGVQEGEGVHVDVYEGLALMRLGHVTPSFSVLDLVRNHTEKLDYIDYHCVEELKVNNFIVRRTGDVLDVYYPNLRSKALVREYIPLKIVVGYPYDRFGCDAKIS